MAIPMLMKHPRTDFSYDEELATKRQRQHISGWIPRHIEPTKRARSCEDLSDEEPVVKIKALDVGENDEDIDVDIEGITDDEVDIEGITDDEVDIDALLQDIEGITDDEVDIEGITDDEEDVRVWGLKVIIKFY